MLQPESHTFFKVKFNLSPKGYRNGKYLMVRIHNIYLDQGETKWLDKSRVDKDALQGTSKRQYTIEY